MTELDQVIQNALAISEASDRMKAFYQIANQLDESIPFYLAKQIEVYAHVLGAIGRLVAAAEKDAGYAEAERKRVYGYALANAQGTSAQKEGIAEQEAFALRLRESEAKADLARWKHAFYATQELINAKKQTLHVLNRELGNGNGGTGR